MQRWLRKIVGVRDPRFDRVDIDSEKSRSLSFQEKVNLYDLFGIRDAIHRGRDWSYESIFSPHSS